MRNLRQAAFVIMARLLFSVPAMTLRTHILLVVTAALTAGGCAQFAPSNDLVFQGDSNGDAATIAPQPPEPVAATAGSPAAGLAFAPGLARVFGGSSAFSVDREQRERAAYVGYEGPTISCFTTITDDRQLDYGTRGFGGQYNQLDRRAITVKTGIRRR